MGKVSRFGGVTFGCGPQIKSRPPGRRAVTTPSGAPWGRPGDAPGDTPGSTPARTPRGPPGNPWGCPRGTPGGTPKSVSVRRQGIRSPNYSEPTPPFPKLPAPPPPLSCSHLAMRRAAPERIAVSNELDQTSTPKHSPEQTRTSKIKLGRRFKVSDELDHNPSLSPSPGQARHSGSTFSRRLKDKILHHPSPLYTPTFNIEGAHGLPREVVFDHPPVDASPNIKTVVGKGGGSAGAGFCPSTVLQLGCCIML